MLHASAWSAADQTKAGVQQAQGVSRTDSQRALDDKGSRAAKAFDEALMALDCDSQNDMTRGLYI